MDRCWRPAISRLFNILQTRTLSSVAQINKCECLRSQNKDATTTGFTYNKVCAQQPQNHILNCVSVRSLHTIRTCDISRTYATDSKYVKKVTKDEERPGYEVPLDTLDKLQDHIERALSELHSGCLDLYHANFFHKNLVYEDHLFSKKKVYRGLNRYSARTQLYRFLGHVLWSDFLCKVIKVNKIPEEGCLEMVCQVYGAGNLLFLKNLVLFKWLWDKESKGLNRKFPFVAVVHLGEDHKVIKITTKRITEGQLENAMADKRLNINWDVW